MFSKKNKNISLRFRQWRRKSYAAFLSIGRHITIGKIKAIVADTLLQKQKETNAFRHVFSFVSFEYFFEEEDDPPAEQQLLLSQAQYSKKETGQQVIFPVKLLYSKWLKATIDVTFSHFYFKQPHKLNPKQVEE